MVAIFWSIFLSEMSQSYLKNIKLLSLKTGSQKAKINEKNKCHCSLHFPFQQFLALFHIVLTLRSKSYMLKWHWKQYFVSVYLCILFPSVGFFYCSLPFLSHTQGFSPVTPAHLSLSPDHSKPLFIAKYRKTQITLTPALSLSFYSQQTLLFQL